MLINSIHESRWNERKTFERLLLAPFLAALRFYSLARCIILKDCLKSLQHGRCNRRESPKIVEFNNLNWLWCVEEEDAKALIQLYVYGQRKVKFLNDFSCFRSDFFWFACCWRCSWRFALFFSHRVSSLPRLVAPMIMNFSLYPEPRTGLSLFSFLSRCRMHNSIFWHFPSFAYAGRGWENHSHEVYFRGFRHWSADTFFHSPSRFLCFSGFLCASASKN